MRERLWRLLDKLTSYYEATLWQDREGPALQYLLGERGFTVETVKRFRIGFAGPSPELRGAFTPTEIGWLERLGHVYEGGSADRFVNRVVFPIMDQQGRPCGFSARILTGDPDYRKYLNSGSSEMFRKGEFLFGLDQAREAIWKADNVIVCEGYTDVLAFHQTGRPIAVGAMGTYFTQAQLLLLGQYSMNLHLTFDGDAAGDEATRKSTEMARAMGFNVSQIVIPGGLDPDDFLIPKK